ncbi:crossover junction endodeoxyribonuclease RuvC [Corynebacterium sp. 335C]
MRVMGVDPGLTRCGLSVADGGRGRSVVPVAVGVARTESGAAVEDRLLRLSNAVEEWIDRYDPDVVAVERVFERGNVSTVIQTAHAVGVVMLAAARRGLEVHQYTPSEVKKALTGNGRADKRQMTSMVTRILGLSEPPKPADAADALALAICHCWRAPLIARERAVAERVAAQKARFDELRRAHAPRTAPQWTAQRKGTR